MCLREMEWDVLLRDKMRRVEIGNECESIVSIVDRANQCAKRVWACKENVF